jgi:hypothetical protein
VQQVEGGEEEERRRGVAEVHGREREGDGAEGVAKGDHHRPPLANDGEKEPDHEHGQQGGGYAADDEGEHLDGLARIWRRLVRRDADQAHGGVGRDSKKRRSRRLVRVVVAVVAGLVAGVVLGLVDLGGVVIHDRGDEVVTAVLVPDRQLVEEAEAEEKEKADEQLPGESRAQFSVRKG